MNYENYEHYVGYYKSSINDTKYINKREIDTLLRIAKKLVPKEKMKKLEGYSSRRKLNELVGNEDNISLLREMQNFEYTKGYKYGVLCEVNKNIDEYLSEVEGIIHKDKLDRCFSDINDPSYRVDNETVDFKFTKVVKFKGTLKAYPVVVSFYRKFNWAIIKYDALERVDMKIPDYFSTYKEIVEWFSVNLDFELKMYNLFPIFKSLICTIRNEPESVPELGLTFEKLEDDTNGALAFTADDDENVSFVDGILRIAEAYGPELVDNIKEYIDQYEDDSFLQRAGIRWKTKIKSRDAIIDVMLRHVRCEHDEGIAKLIHIHFEFSYSLCKERIDHVIKYLYKNI